MAKRRSSASHEMYQERLVSSTSWDRTAPALARLTGRLAHVRLHDYPRSWQPCGVAPANRDHRSAASFTTTRRIAACLEKLSPIKNGSVRGSGGGRGVLMTWIDDILDRYEAPLLRFATRLTGCPQRAADVVQDALCALCTHTRDHQSRAASRITSLSGCTQPCVTGRSIITVRINA